MAKKDLTPQQQYNIAKKREDRAQRKIDKITRKEPFYTVQEKENIKKLQRIIENSRKDQNLAEYQIKHPAPIPLINDTSKTTIIQTEINAGNNKNSATANFSAQFNKKDCKGKSKQNNKQTKVKFWFTFIVVIIVLAGVIALTVHITNCVNGF